MDPGNKKASLPSSTKYNYEAMKSYNFDSVDFDFDFGFDKIDEKKHNEMRKQA